MNEMKQLTSPVLYLVVPCYNEEEVLPQSSKEFDRVLTDLIAKNIESADSKIMFVNDGSKDKTWSLIQQFSQENPHFSGISLARNRGHQNALLAGLMTAKKFADITVSLDADLQDDINAVYEMVEKYKNGCDVVFGVRSERKTDTVFKRATAQGFYKLMQKMGVKLVFDHADVHWMHCLNIGK